MTADHTTPYAIYGFFRSFRGSLPDEQDFEDFVATLTITPLHAVIENVVPFFRRSTDPDLLTKFQVMIRQCEQNSAFESTFMRVCDALDMLQRVEKALRFDKRLMDEYLRAMQFDNASASHQQVWNGLQRFLNEDCDPNTKRRMERVFAEQKASDELVDRMHNLSISLSDIYLICFMLLGLSDDVLAVAHSLIGDDTLYVEILETLQLNNRQNLPWDTVVDKIQRITSEKKPQAWPMLSRFLNDVHSDVSSLYWEEYLDDDIVNDEEYEPENDFSVIEQKFSDINLDADNVTVADSSVSQEQQKQSREVIGAV
ncbi:43840_t:CDS:2 [Gigaspora margarita]|uniref:43840_t:CDS:1 n=1 Tax=Gigaspora margarita TaxID=4874 RepID=A0ABN7UKU6_GIGMA|nr:43840_t:CDS:2 [Gigaspora margarita]